MGNEGQISHSYATLRHLAGQGTARGDRDSRETRSFRRRSGRRRHAQRLRFRVQRGRRPVYLRQRQRARSLAAVVSADPHSAHPARLGRRLGEPKLDPPRLVSRRTADRRVVRPRFADRCRLLSPHAIPAVLPRHPVRARLDVRPRDGRASHEERGKLEERVGTLPHSERANSVSLRRMSRSDPTAACSFASGDAERTGRFIAWFTRGDPTAETPPPRRRPIEPRSAVGRAAARLGTPWQCA